MHHEADRQLCSPNAMPSNDPQREGVNRRRVLITAGPTHEPIDEVRYISNRSSGRLGIETALAAAERGNEVTLLLGPTAETGPEEPSHTLIKTHRFRTASDLLVLLEEHFPNCDALIMSAAVADYRPVIRESSPRPAKIPRGSDSLTLHLEPVTDLVATCAAERRPDQIIVAFALEPSERLAQSGREKLTRKGVDAIVANALASMEGRSIAEALFITTDGEIALDPALDKGEFARWLIRAVDARLESGSWTVLSEPPFHNHE